MEKSDLLLKLTSTHIILSLRAQSFHWNVTGPHFFELHDIFGDIYKTLHEHTDELAERMRALGDLAPASPYEIYASSFIKNDNNSAMSAEMMVSLLRDDLSALVDACREVVEVMAHDVETADMLTGFMTDYGKYIWMTNSFLGE